MIMANEVVSIRLMVRSHMGWGLNTLSVPTWLFPRVSCLLKILGLAGGPSFEPGSTERVWGVSGYKNK